MDKEIGTYNYGLCLFSLDHMTAFLKEKKIRSKKVLALFQKNKDVYLESIKNGVWMPVPSINSGKYVICVEGYDTPFGEEWTQILSYDGFNIDVKNGLWISDIGTLLEFDKMEYEGEGREETSPYGTVSYYSNKEQWHKDLNGHVTYSGFWYDVPEGKYLLTVTGFARKEATDDKKTNYGFQFKLTKVDGFFEMKNPREETYDFNIGWLHQSKRAIVHWLPGAESGVTWPLKQKEDNKMIVIPLGEDKYAYLTIVYDIANQTEENTNHCRVVTRYKTPKDFVLEGGKEYPIFEEVYKRGKTSYKELGCIECW
jgi:hypothetical protein